LSYTVYKHTGPTGKVYIGITGRAPRKRWDNGRGYAHCPHFSAAIQKYGWENFEHEILETGLTRAQAAAREVELIAKHKSADRKFGYNTDLGGFAPGRISDETRAKLSANISGDKNPTRRYGHPMLGKRHSEESKARMSAAAKARTNRVCTPETRSKLQKAQKKRPVINLDTGEVFESVHAAGRFLGKDPSHVSGACKGKKKIAYGYHWAYLEDYLKDRS
jgi:group I intron endonuclease